MGWDQKRVAPTPKILGQSCRRRHARDVRGEVGRIPGIPDLGSWPVHASSTHGVVCSGALVWLVLEGKPKGKEDSICLALYFSSLSLSRLTFQEFDTGRQRMTSELPIRLLLITNPHHLE